MTIREPLNSNSRNESPKHNKRGVRVSVIVPTYARPQQLKRCLESFCLQTLCKTSFEVLVVDDGSPEPLDAVVASVQDRLIVRMIHQNHAGPATARNHGVQQACGELIAFTDDDCRPRPDWLQKLVERENEAPGSLIGGSTINGLPEEVFTSASQLIVDLVYAHFNADAERAYFLTSNNLLCSKAALLEIGGFDTTFTVAGGEDREFCDRWRLAGKRLIWHKTAVIDHFHSQSLRKFLNLCFRYGVGAHLYQAKRKQRQSGTMREDLGFHRTLPRLLLQHFQRCGWKNWLAICPSLFLWQVANAAGFFYQALRTRSIAPATTTKAKTSHDNRAPTTDTR